jgi:hypothetical protein
MTGEADFIEASHSGRVDQYAEHTERMTRELRAVKDKLRYEYRRKESRRLLRENMDSIYGDVSYPSAGEADMYVVAGEGFGGGATSFDVENPLKV